MGQSAWYNIKGMVAMFDTIYCGDAIKILSDWPGDSIHLAFADPPFNIGYDYDVYDDNRASHEYVDWSR